MGATIMVILLLVALPIGIILGTSAIAPALGIWLNKDAAKRNADSELLETNY